MTKILAADEAVAFLQNMRWFAGLGRITARKLSNGRVSIHASKVAWSYWVEVG